jgi:3-dehydroquinate synthase
MKIQARFAVSYEHQVHFTRAAFAPDNPLLADVLSSRPETRPPRVLFVIDDGLAKAKTDLVPLIRNYFAGREGQLQLCEDMVFVPGGEAAKNSEDAVQRIYAAIEENGLCRHCYLVAIGGGALLDVAGFAAATAHRGIRHLRMPSTVLGQNDAGVGVKNGFNWRGKKNFVGTFSPPFAVINDFELLATLPHREKRAGLIEAIKVALIRDAEFFEAIERDRDRLRRFEPAVMEELIRRCAEAHVRHITTCGDPFELGSARPLDFGHWAAHKLEPLSGFRIHHGEAVAIGIALDVIYSQLAGHLSAASAERILALIESFGFELWAGELDLREPNGEPTVIRGLEDFREHLGGALTITLLGEIGRGFEVHSMDTSTIEEAMKILAERAVKS